MNLALYSTLRSCEWLKDALLTACKKAFPYEPAIEIISIQRRMQRIHSHHEFNFVLRSPDANCNLILKLHQGMFSHWGGTENIKAAKEYSAMIQAYQAGISVPFPYGFSSSEKLFGHTYIIHDAGDGHFWWEEGDSLRIVQGDLVESMADQLGAIHRQVGPNHSLIPTIYVYDLLQQLWNRVNCLGNFELNRCIQNCLKQCERIAPAPHCFLHGQYDIDHLLLNDKTVRTIAHWEHAAIGDPRWDVAYTSMTLQRKNDRSLSNRFVARYVQCTGNPLNDLEFWEGLVALRYFAISQWLQSLDAKGFASVIGLQTDLFDKDETMREKALRQFS